MSVLFYYRPLVPCLRVAGSMHTEWCHWRRPASSFLRRPRTVLHESKITPNITHHWYVTCNCKAAPGLPHGCTTGCPQGAHKPMVKCVCAKPRVPLGCPPCSQNASPATVWWGAPRAVPWGIINIKREETDRGAPPLPPRWTLLGAHVSTEAPVTGHCLAPLFPRRPQSRTDMACRTNYRAAPLFLQTPHRLPATVHTCRAPSGPLVPECVCMHCNGVGQPTENFRC